MAWSGSAIFQQAMLNPIAGRCWTTAAPTTYSSLSADSIKCALYNAAAATPDKAAAVASTGYNTGQWVSGNEATGRNGKAAMPMNATAAMSSAVATGRLMNGADRFTGRSRSPPAAAA